MGLAAGIIGLPNVGKSTLLNALCRAGAQTANYPFCTIEKNIGTARVPDEMLSQLQALLAPQEAIPATVEIVDIAGLVPGASQGAGLGNRFLSEIREVDALVHVVRCFRDENVSHVQGNADPLRDVELIETELALSDLERLQKAMAHSKRDFSPQGRKTQAALEKLEAALAAGKSVSSVYFSEEEEQLVAPGEYLTGKPVLFVANVDEEGLYGENPGYQALCRRFGAERVLPLSAKLEAECAELEQEERTEFLAQLGFTEDCLPRLIEATFRLLGLIRFYTFANNKLRAWEIPHGTDAVTAAGKIHTDMQTGFIRAEIIELADLKKYPSLPELRKQGLVRSEGKDYQLRDGDLVHFLFSGGHK
jgi:hypothetical protein